MIHLAQIPFPQWIRDGDALILPFLVGCRFTGWLLLVPFFSHKLIQNPLKSLFLLMLTASVSMYLYPDYFGDTAKYSLPSELGKGEIRAFALVLLAIKELCLGYVIGFCFALIIEALILAGHTVSSMIGFSMAELIDPLTNNFQSMVSTLFSIMGMLLILCLDLHHTLLSICIQSFEWVPIGIYHAPEAILSDLSLGTARIFSYSLQYSAVSYIILFLMTLGLGYMAKIMPEMNVFMVGFPLRIFVGYFALIFAVGYFPDLLQSAFNEYTNLATRLLHRIATGN